MPSRVLQLEPVHHLAPRGPGAWTMTGSDPQFLVRGPFERGVWEWRFRAAARTAAPAPPVQIYYAPNGDFSELASVRFAPLARTPGEYRLRWWLPFRAAVLRFDPADAAGELEIGEIVAIRRNRAGAAVAALARDIRRGGATALRDWIVAAARALPGGPGAVRHALLDRVLRDGPEGADTVAATVEERAPRYHASPESGLFALITTAYDTRAAYLDELAGSLRAQSWADYEWILLDNGSTSRETRRALDRIAKDPRVRLLRAETNLGIIGGMRYVLERATARYVLPVDSDDYLFPDALAIVAAAIQREGYPALLYSDEDKLRDGRHVDAFRKPGWDPVLFRNCCYIAHLCAIRRDEALRLGAYMDAAAEGCHDWDTFLRITRAGHTPVHVPEVLYSWRMHGASTAANVAAKDYVVNSQRHVLEEHLKATGRSTNLSVVRSPFFPGSPDWWIRRERRAATPVPLVVYDPDPDSIARLVASAGGYPISRAIACGPEATLLQALRAAAPEAPFVVVAHGGIEPRGDEWLWEMAGLKESFPDAMIIGGRMFDRDGTVVSPDGVRRAADDPGDFGTALKQRTTDIVSLALAALDAAWLLELPAQFDQIRDPARLGAALAEAAAGAGGRVIVSPFIEAAAHTLV